jgi:extradiol dioxygenase family protein
MMPALDVIAEPVRFHLSLNVPDLARAVEFYALLFGTPPAKRHADYAKFDLDDPPVVFSLVPQAPGPGATLSHLGLRVASDDTIRAFRERLEAAGVCCERQDGTTCGYARQNKLWVQDPFGNFWEVYRVEEDVRPEAVRTSLDGKAARADGPACGSHPAGEAVWEHFVTHPLPDRVPHADGTVDEVRLTGTFNAGLSADERAFVVAEAARVLRPGGKVVTHGLMADRPFAGDQPKLPGLAAMVSRVPVQTEPAEAFVRAGFVGVQVVKYTDKAWFAHAGAELREVKLVAWKPRPAGDGPRAVLYKGPFAAATADGGHRFERGRRTAVSAAVWEQLRLGPAAEQFLFFEPGAGAGCGT